MEKKVLSLFVFVILFLISCGKKEGESWFGVNSASQFKSVNCGYDVISDYNSVALACGYRSEGECDSYIKRFLEKYPGINCEARSGTGLDEKTVRISEEYLNSLRR